MWLELARTVHLRGLATNTRAFVLGCVIAFVSLPASLSHAQQRVAPDATLEPAAAGTDAVLQQRRPLTYDDLLRLERLGRAFGGEPVAFSPDGRQLAYVRVRPKNAATVHDQPYMGGNDRADIWLAAAAGGEATRITTGASDGFGYWAPLWSPDGEHLALYSTRDDNVRLHMWERGTGDLRRLSERGADFHSDPIWLSSSEIVFTVLPKGERPPAFDIMRQTPEIATEAWPKVREGTVVTSSVLESGVPADLAARPHGQLLLYDLRGDEARVLFDGDVRDLTPSPDNELVAGFVTTDVFLPRSGRPLPHQANHASHEVRLFNRDGLVPAEPLSAVKDVILGSLEWAPDGSKFVFAGSVDESGRSTESEESTHEILVFTPASGTLDRYALGELNPLMPAGGYVAPPKIRWSGDGRLVVYAREAEGERADWWLIHESGERQNLTGELDSAPSELYRVAGSDSWVGRSEGDVWQVSEEGAAPMNLTESVSEKVIAFAWVDEERAKTRGLTEVLVRASSRPGESSLYRIELQGSGPPLRLEKPRPTAELTGFSAAAGLAVFSANDRTGSCLWLTPLASSEPELLFETNLFLREIAEAETRRIEYRGLDGDSLSAWIILPPNYAETAAGGDAHGGVSAARDSDSIELSAAARRQTPGEQPPEAQRYPLVVWVYAGSMAREHGPSSLAELNDPHPLNLQLLAAQGYAVLLPSMPLEPPDQPSDPYLELTKGVIPAVDRAIRPRGSGAARGHGTELWRLQHLWAGDADRPFRCRDLDYAIAKSLAAAPFADLLWMETKTADLEDARRFAEAIHERYPDKMLAYNLSPSFNWDTTGLSDEEMTRFPEELGKLGFVFNFITYGGHQIDGLAAEEFAMALRQEGMLALARLQRKFRLLESPYRTPQTLVGGPRLDGALMASAGRTAATKAMGKGSTQFQHLVQTEVPTKLLEDWLDIWREHNDWAPPMRVELRVHSPGSELLELRVLDEAGAEHANVIVAEVRDRRGRTLLSIRDQNTAPRYAASGSWRCCSSS